MTLAIFSVIVLAVVVGLMVLIIKNVKSSTVKVILSIVVVLAGVIVEVIGVGVIGFVAVGDSVNKAVEEQKKTDQAGINSRVPMIVSTGEKKDVFAKTDVVKGNGLEITILKTLDITDFQEIQYTDKKVFCGIEFKIKNVYKDKQTITSLDFEMQQPDGTIIYPAYTSDKALADYNYLSTELQVDKEAEKKIAFDCKAAKKPLTFLYKGGEYLNFSFFVNEADKKFVPIKYSVDF